MAKKNAIQRTENVTFLRLALALANDYESIYYLNTENNSYVEYAASGDKKELTVISGGEDFFNDTIVNCRRIVFKDDQERFLAAINKKTLLEAAKTGEAFTLDYRLVVRGYPEYYSLKTIKGTGLDENYLIIGIRNIDKQVKKEEALAAESRIYEKVAMTLVGRYEYIYYVNVETDKYREFRSRPGRDKKKNETLGYDFFSAVFGRILENVYAEDRGVLEQMLEKERFVSGLRLSGNFNTTFRVIVDEKPIYVSMWAAVPEDDEKHIVVALTNVDLAKRRELEMREALGTAIDQANTDPLTGVKNKLAYVRMEKKLDKCIAQKLTDGFSVVVTDVNGLKYINDTQGHLAGDDFIKSACAIVCRIFKHSPVYRIGGDEFTVILQNEDYQNREALMEQLRSTMEGNRKNGLVTAAVGISDYDKTSDRIVEDVFQRADKAMYEDKSRYKKKI